MLIEEWLSGILDSKLENFCGSTVSVLSRSYGESNLSIMSSFCLFVCCFLLIVICTEVSLFRYHPDKNPNDPVAADMFKEITFAYDALSDPETRRQYDTTGSEVRFIHVLCFNIV